MFLSKSVEISKKYNVKKKKTTDHFKFTIMKKRQPNQKYGWFIWENDLSYVWKQYYFVFVFDIEVRLIITVYRTPNTLIKRPYVLDVYLSLKSSVFLDETD